MQASCCSIGIDLVCRAVRSPAWRDGGGNTSRLRRREPDGWILAVFLVGKLVYEQVIGVMPYSAKSAGGPVVVDAHLYGAIGALIITAPLAWLRKPL